MSLLFVDTEELVEHKMDMNNIDSFLLFFQYNLILFDNIGAMFTTIISNSLMFVLSLKINSIKNKSTLGGAVIDNIGAYLS